MAASMSDPTLKATICAQCGTSAGPGEGKRSTKSHEMHERTRWSRFVSFRGSCVLVSCGQQPRRDSVTNLTT